MIIVDTGVLVGYLDRDDPLQTRAEAAMDEAWSGAHGAVVSADVVVQEGMNFLRRKVRREELSREFAGWFEAGDDRAEIDLLWTDETLFREAIEIHFFDYRRGLSLTDCTLIAHARRRDAKILTFDGGFDGIVEVVHP